MNEALGKAIRRDRNVWMPKNPKKPGALTLTRSERNETIRSEYIHYIFHVNINLEFQLEISMET